MSSEKTAKIRNLIKLPADPGDWEFTSVLISRPINFLILHVIGDLKFITPNLVTLAGFGCFLAASGFIWSNPGARFLIAALLFARLILDDLDGMLARYRGGGSSFGSYLDKVTDIIGFFVFFTVLGYVVYRQTSTPWPLIVSSAGIFGLMGTGYVKWVVASMIAKAPTTNSPQALKVGPLRVLLTLMFIKIWAVNECDIFLFSIIFILFGFPVKILLYILATTQILQFSAMLVIRGLQAAGADKKR
ncbi:CDP-alcohol phosphatidyltransferase family protein [Myxococcota bacterium]|nr:CDP-alcohol phosphatidyltransferase family protein [Myxococcota bacterium]MBU1382487.1 CDP-alcohol phosphatidyltransferase family protein [Myxococcota bacterium]MBU1497951.1 CDP-alcohol phosphatidyltransferase family protein [Myxococcota bacterium]